MSLSLPPSSFARFATPGASSPADPAPAADGAAPEGAPPATVVVVGPGDRATAERVAGWVHGLIRAGTRNLVVDVSAAHDCDTHLLTVLARTRGLLTELGGTLEVTGVALPQFLTALRAAGLDEVFVVYDALRPDRRPRSGQPARPA